MYRFPLSEGRLREPSFSSLMYLLVQFLLFLWLGLYTGYCSLQWKSLVDATTTLSSAALQNNLELNDKSGISYESSTTTTIGNNGGGWDSSSRPDERNTRQECLVEAGEKLYSCQEVRNEVCINFFLKGGFFFSFLLSLFVYFRLLWHGKVMCFHTRPVPRKGGGGKRIK